jgi:hypothetical protein
MPDFPAPLPLTAFEEYMLWDDRPTYPMSIVARLRFAGQLDRAATAEALATVVARHPLLRAKIRKTPAGRLEWIAAETSPPAILWIDGPPSDRLPAMRPIDLFSEPGWRAWATTDSQGSSLVLQVHHAVCDGKAVTQVLDDFVRSYARIAAGKQAGVPPLGGGPPPKGGTPAPELSPCDPQTLPGRGRFGLTVGKYLRMLPAQVTGLLGVRQFLMRQPVPLLAANDAGAPGTPGRGDLPGSFPDVKVGRLEAEDLRRLSAAAADSKATVNDWLLRDFFVAVADFRSRQQTAGTRSAGYTGEWIRFVVPMNLREAADIRMPAANVVSMVFLDRNPAQIADPGGLLRSIHAEMDLIRRRKLGLIFILSLWVLRALPGGMAGRVNKVRCEATCVFSNLGRVLADSPLPRSNGRIVAGDVVLDGIDCFSTLREGTAVAVALVFYAGELQVCMQYDVRRITEAQAEDLMATYLRKIRSSLDAASRAT